MVMIARSFVVALVLSALFACAGPRGREVPGSEPLGSSEPLAPSGPWFGQDPPGPEPAIFAPRLVSTGGYQRDIAWTPDGRQVFWSLFAFGDRHGTIVTARQGEDGAWGDPEILPMFREHSSLEPFVSPDGSWLWFASQRPLPGEDEAGDWNLWRAPRAEDGWGDPEPVSVGGDGDEFYPSTTRDGLLVFTATGEDSLGGEDLYASLWTGDAWSEPENLGPAVNSPGPEFNSLIHPDGDWILFGSAREGDAGGGDLYLSRADGAGGWRDAVPLPEPLNSPQLDFCPALSPDGSTLFFSSRRSTVAPEEVVDYSDLLARLEGPGNGQCDIWWVDASVLDAIGVPAEVSDAEESADQST